METLAGHVFDDVVYRLALIESVEERGERAQVQPGGADAQEVGLNSSQFAGDGAEDFASRGEFDAHELFGRRVPGQFVVDGSGVIHPVHDGDVLVVIEMFAALFEPAVKVADMGGCPEDSFTVEFQDQTQGGMGGRVLGSKVQGPTVFPAGAAHFRRQDFARGLAERKGHGPGL